MPGNVAIEEEGAIYASGSTININTWTQTRLLTIRNNSAKSEEGYIWKHARAKIVIARYSDSHSNLVDFTGNSADYRGAVFMSDDCMHKSRY